jgi:hypothetical protein
MNKVARRKIGAGSPPTREPGPDLSVPIPEQDARRWVGADIIEDELWPAVGTDGLSEQKSKEGEPLLSHNYRS